jgi:hypothetical protein
LRMPTGFMRINRSMIEKMIEHYPERKYTDITFDQGEAEAAWDLFPCGLATAPDGSRHWDGEDTGFCRLWAEMGGEMWIYPDIIFNHYSEEKYYRGNYKQFLEAQIVVIPETKAA